MRIALLLLVPALVAAVSDDEFFAIQRAERQLDAHTVKTAVARFDEAANLPEQNTNGDQQRYVDLRGNFNKGLRHLSSGYPDSSAYHSVVKALSTGSQSDFNAIGIGQGVFKLVNPQASLAYSLTGNDAWLNSIPPAPAFASAQAAGEMVELYWTALVRDVPFNEFGTNGTVGLAATDLNTLSDFRGPKENGLVTRGTFLRGNTPGDLAGPYVSQFLFLDIPFGAITISQKTLNVPVAKAAPDGDFLYEFNPWFTVITGGNKQGDITPTETAFIRTPRDLTAYVHSDVPGQAAYAALRILVGLGAPLDPASPYNSNPTQEGFVTFGIGEYLALVQAAVQDALKGAWYHKWQVNRRCRPEEYGFYVDQQVTHSVSLGINSQLTSSPVLDMIFSTYGSRFLPQAYPEGSPVHPSYPAGHATFVGAAVTVLKAFFDETYELNSVALQPTDNNLDLIAYSGTDTLTVGGELNKLAANISLGRDHAGVHYRSDGFDGMNLGEKIAIDVLNNESFCFNEGFEGFTLTKFDGTTITVGGKR